MHICIVVIVDIFFLFMFCDALFYAIGYVSTSHSCTTATLSAL